MLLPLQHRLHVLESPTDSSLIERIQLVSKQPSSSTVDTLEQLLVLVCDVQISLLRLILRSVVAGPDRTEVPEPGTGGERDPLLDLLLEDVVLVEEEDKRGVLEARVSQDGLEQGFGLQHFVGDGGGGFGRGGCVVVGQGDDEDHRADVFEHVEPFVAVGHAFAAYSDHLVPGSHRQIFESSWRYEKKRVFW